MGPDREGTQHRSFESSLTARRVAAAVLLVLGAALSVRTFFGVDGGDAMQRRAEPTIFQPLFEARPEGIVLPPARAGMSIHSREELRASKRLEPRLGVCVVGDAQLLERTWPSMVTNVLDALQPNPALRVVVVQLGTEPDCRSLVGRRGYDACMAEGTRVQDTLHNHSSDLRRSLSSAGAEVEVLNDFTCTHPLLQTPSTHQCCRKYRNAVDDRYGVLGMARYMRRRWCYERLKQHEVDTGHALDFIVSLRTDVYMFEPLPPASYFVALEPRVFGVAAGKPWGDAVLMSSRAVADQMHDSMDTVFRQPCGDNWPNYKRTSPESRLDTLMTNFVIHQLWPVHAALITASDGAECDALRNDIVMAQSLSVSQPQTLAFPTARCLETFPRRSTDGTHRLEVVPTDSNPRVGICVVGGARTFGIVWPIMQTNLIDALQPDPSRRHVVLELTTASDCDANHHNAGRIRDECEQHVLRTNAQLEDRNSTLRRSMGTDVRLSVENAFHCGHPFMKGHACCVANPNAMNNHGGYWGMTQYMRRRLCYERLKEHENRTGHRFDFIVTTRPDFYFFEPLPPASYFLSMQPRVLATTKIDTWGDFLFMMTRGLSDYFDEIVDSVFRSPCEEGGNLEHSPEYRIAPVLSDEVVHQQWPVHGCIARGDTVADCGRIENDIVRVGMINASGGMEFRNPACIARFPGGPPPTTSAPGS